MLVSATLSSDIEGVAMSKVWLVTGSSRGFGRAIVNAVLRAGHRLVATARDIGPLAYLSAEYGERVRLFALDVTDPAAARRAVQVAVEEFGRLDVVVNNAGYSDVASIEHMEEEVFRAQIETNLFGVVNVTRAALPQMRQQRAGHFIQFSSIGGRTGAPGLSAYQAAKFAVAGFSEVLATETAALGIKVTLIEPGAFRTDWAGSSMRIAPIDPDYASSVGYVAQHLRTNNGKQPGDPARAAQVLLKLVAMESPPLHLLLGRDAVDIAAAATRKLAESDAKYRELSLSTEFQDELAAGAEQFRLE
jgi:NAD(P)-dependent dehydrogenase (short-subunit alcohol dehydrogenase family)